ncbi:MAG: transporter substrate-binding domain-containing protein [Rhodocyclales bacterium]|nr:transporter substrate-binding domain-containing protein [Rhodocyclales bacterium]
MALWALFPALLRGFRKGRRAAAALGALAIALHAAPAAATEAGEKSALDKIRQSGTLTVALYKEYAPFSDDGRGIDVDLATALAAKLGVKMSPMWFHAGEKMDDDLRKMVWKGTPIGYGPADLMMHVPVDRQYMAKIDQVRIFAPYHRERFAIGRQVEKLPVLDNLEPFEKLSIGVEGESMGALVMLSADSGHYRETLKIFKSAEEAVAALKSGAVVAALAQQGELESGLRDDPRFAIDPPPHPILKMQQWVVGLAVKADSEELAKALETAMNELLADGTVKRIMQHYGVKSRQP